MASTPRVSAELVNQAARRAESSRRSRHLRQLIEVGAEVTGRLDRMDPDDPATAGDLRALTRMLLAQITQQNELIADLLDNHGEIIAQAQETVTTTDLIVDHLAGEEFDLTPAAD